VARTACPETDRSIAIELPLEPASARRARAALDPLRAHVDDSSFDVLRLLVSELVCDALAIQPANPGTPIALRAEVRDGSAMVRVDGAAIRLPARKPELGNPGWGVYLVQRLATRWGAVRDWDGMQVWFDLAPDPGPAAVRP
jgi:hypothetical protein